MFSTVFIRIKILRSQVNNLFDSFFYKILSENVPKLTDTANLVNELCKISSLNIALAKS